MQTLSFPFWHRAALGLALLVGLAAVPAAHAQQQSGDSPLEAVRFGAGLGMFSGDLDANPNNNPIKYLGAGHVHLMAGVELSLGPIRPLQVELAYDRLSGRLPKLEFTNNAVSLDVGTTYTPSFLGDGLFGIVAGIGPTLLVSPTYGGENFEDEAIAGDDRYDKLGTRIVPALKLGVTVQDRLRLGIRLTTSDYVDGHTGLEDTGIDSIFFLSFTPRIALD